MPRSYYSVRMRDDVIVEQPIPVNDLAFLHTDEVKVIADSSLEQGKPFFIHIAYDASLRTSLISTLICQSHGTSTVGLMLWYVPVLSTKNSPRACPLRGSGSGAFFLDDLEVGIYTGNNPYLFIHET